MNDAKFQQGCLDCGTEWNTVVIMDGEQISAEPPRRCPMCNSESIVKLAEGWREGQKVQYELRSLKRGEN